MKKKKVVKDDYNYRRLFLVFTIMISIIIAISTYWIYAYKHKHPYLEDTYINYKIDDYFKIKGNVVHLEKIDNKISKDFLDRQNTIINNNKVIDTDITKTIYKDVLSIKISYILNGELSNYEEIIILNYDLKENKILDNDDLLNKSATTYKEIAESIFNKYIKLENINIKVIDAITNEEMTGNEFNNNSYKYITRIRENLPDMINLYIEDGKLYYIVNLKDINKLCYLTNKDNSNKYITEEIDKL